MTQEEKSLLLQDLCARLPYGVKCKIALYKTAFNVLGIVEDKVKLDSPVYDEGDDWWEVTEVKPYLRPISSMTEEEKKEYKHFVAFSGNPTGSANFIDWLNKKMFDYHTDYEGKTMIEKGLALEAPDGMYK